MNIPQAQIECRAFLQGYGALLALPFLESLARPVSAIASTGKVVERMRTVCLGLEYGMHPDGFFPTETGMGPGDDH